MVQTPDTPRAETATPVDRSSRRPLLSRPVARAVLVMGGLATFLGVASVVKPPPRGATASPVPALRHPPAPAPRPAATVATSMTAVHPRGWALIGSLEGREHGVRAYASPDGPRYSVYAPDGRLLQADLPADEVYRAFPDLDLEKLRLDPPEGGALMLAPSD